MRFHILPPFPGSEVIQGCVSGDAKHPTQEAALLCVRGPLPLKRLQDTKKRLLEEVVGGTRILDHSQQEPIYAILMPLDQRSNSAFVTPLRVSDNELFVG